jgi:uncharacterized 2Fe-2S/4Fe-4S cluster protein (DUF4445 family)
MYTIKIINQNKTYELKAESGTNLLELLRKNKINISAPCNGKGKCGKCKVIIESGADKPTDKETKLLGKSLLSKGYRLACYVKIKSDMTVNILKKASGNKIISKFQDIQIKVEPHINKKHTVLKEPALDDQKSDLERITGTFKNPVKPLGMNINSISKVLRESNYDITSVYFENKLSGIESGNTKKDVYGVAFDIGTTTIASYLYNLETGVKTAISSIMNPQRKFGHDVISRIDYTIESPENQAEMHNEIISCINTLIDSLCKKSSIDNKNIYLTTFVGNTTMMHFLMNLSAKNIATAPFIPVTTACHLFDSSSLGINCSEFGKTIVFPSVSGYIGADTVAAVLASGMSNKKDVSLLIDIGTNGEIVIGNNKKLISCSTAAGPAFEGANIHYGTGGIEGAIDSVSLYNDDIKITAIDNKKPIGICGSGIVDAVSFMLETGIIDETGRIQEEDEIPDNTFKNRIVEINDNKAFIISEKDRNGIDEDIYINQKDIRELQNAKAAIFAGIMTLIYTMGIEADTIKNVYLAGGFGNYIDIKSAVNISLIPKELEKKIKPIGNAAGLGAVMGLLSKRNIKNAIKLKDRIEYIELSANPKFTEVYIDSMIF